MILEKFNHKIRIRNGVFINEIKSLSRLFLNFSVKFS